MVLGRSADSKLSHKRRRGSHGRLPVRSGRPRRRLVPQHRRQVRPEHEPMDPNGFDELEAARRRSGRARHLSIRRWRLRWHFSTQYGRAIRRQEQQA